MLPVMVEPVEVNVPAFHTPIPEELPWPGTDTVLSSIRERTNVSLPLLPIPPPAAVAVPASGSPVLMESP
jgi:hypothetical protein